MYDIMTLILAQERFTAVAFIAVLINEYHDKNTIQ